MNKIKRVKVTKLFGTFNHIIPFSENSNFTLILGENGLGKTVILKLIKIVFSGNYSDLKQYDFDRFDIEFYDDKFSFFGSTDPETPRLVVKKYVGRKMVKEVDLLNPKYLNENFNSRRYYSDNQAVMFENDFIEHKFDPEIEYIIDRFLGRYVRQVGRNSWMDLRSGGILRTESVLAKYNHALPERFKGRATGVPVWLKEFSDRNNVYLIETQRLKSKKGADSNEESVIEISKELSQKIRGLLADANENASQLDRSYPNRLLARISKLEPMSDEELNNQLALLEERRTKLRNVGLVDPFDDIQKGRKITKTSRLSDADELINNVLRVYVEDSNKKLDVYNEIAFKLEIFLNILNDRLNVKYVKVDKEEGLKVFSEKDKRKIPLTGLSSGEQHMIILFYNLLFKCEDDSLILIDEPEISLHINWQNEFITDLGKINKITPFEALIATHSPDIINENWDLTVQLNED